MVIGIFFGSSVERVSKQIEETSTRTKDVVIMMVLFVMHFLYGLMRTRPGVLN